MKRMLKIVGIVLGVLLVVVVSGLTYLSHRPAAPTNYQSLPVEGEIERTYMAQGAKEVVKQEETLLLDFGKFLLFYPKEIETSTQQYPVIVIANGSGTPLSKYEAVARHYASWGFIVIGTEEKNSWNAFGSEMSLRYLERVANELPDRPLYQKVDFDHVGIVGHSQGGVGVINAITDTKHQSLYKTAVSLSPTNKTLAHNLFWDYDATKVQVPTLLISGAGGEDDWVVTGEQLTEIYNDIPSAKAMMRRKETPHNEVLYKPDGYVMAWFMWQLKGDGQAARAFVGDSPEVLRNNQYQDQVLSLE